MKTKSLFELADDYKKGKFNPREYKWEYEPDMAENYSLFVTHKKNKDEFYAYDGAKTLGTLKAVGKMFNVRVKEKK
jgi:hypothetical protein